jgi:UDP-glucuronate 4-epimerase
MQELPQRVLLTGGAGFIGSHVAEALLHAGLDVSIIDNFNDFYSPGQKESNLRHVRAAGAFRLFVADITDEAALSTVFALCAPQAVIHLAAYAGVRPSLERPRLYTEVNVAGTLNLLERCRRFGVQNFVFGSSSSVYGTRARVPFSESETVLRPISPYAATKVAGEMLGHTYAHLYGLPVICLRFFTVYGPRQRPDLAIHKFTRLIERGEEVPVYGNGHTGRDYTHVSDIVQGVVAALRYRPENGGVPFEVFNLGNSHPVPLLELLDTLEHALGKRAKRVYCPMEPGDVSLTWADISKATRLLNYRPTVSLADGLDDFVEWYRQTFQTMETAMAV